MSTPPNILDNFRSYSYHHILIACSNQDVVDRLTAGAGNDLSAYNSLQTFQPVTIEEEDGTEREIGEYYVIINGLRDSQYTIESVQWENVFAASVNATDYGNSFGLTGTMTVNEARGFLFLNVLNAVADRFQTGFSSTIFILKTVFIGHAGPNEDRFVNESGTRVIADLKPLRMILYDVKGSFDIQGGKYKIDFLGVENGASRLPQYARAAENVGSFTPSSVILQDVMNDLADKLNESAQESFLKMKQELKEKSEEENIETNIDGENLRRVYYQIELDEAYQDPSYTVELFDQNFKNDTDGPGTFKWGRSLTVEQAIQDVLRRSQKIQDDLNKPSADGLRYRYKINSQMTIVDKSPLETSQTPSSTDVEGVLFKYTIQRVIEVTDRTLRRILDPEEGDPTLPGADIIANSLLTFDYFFTGRNVDIMKMELNLNQGLTFVQTLRTTNNTQTAIQQQKNAIPAATDVVATDVRYQREVIPPTTPAKDDLARNVGNPLSTTAFNAALSRHASLEQIQTEFTIRGNPYLMSNMNTPPTEKNETNADAAPDSRNVMTNWHRAPALIKVNIKMPERNEPPSGRPIDADDNRLIDFWYTGYYYITGVVHKFSGGEFTQDVTALAIPRDDIYTQSSKKNVGETPQVDEETTSDEAENLAKENAADPTPAANSGPILTAKQMADRTKATLLDSPRRRR